MLAVACDRSPSLGDGLLPANTDIFPAVACLHRKITSANSSQRLISVTRTYTCDAAGTGDNFRVGICSQWAMSAIETPKKILTSEVCFLCKTKVSSEENIKVFGKSTVAIHSLILCVQCNLNLSVRLRLTMSEQAWHNSCCFVMTSLWPLEFSSNSSNKDVLGR